MKILAATLLTLSLLLAPVAQADTGVGHSGKGQTHSSVNNQRPVPPEWVKHLIEQIFGTRH